MMLPPQDLLRSSALLPATRFRRGPGKARASKHASTAGPNPRGGHEGARPLLRHAAGGGLPPRPRRRRGDRRAGGRNLARKSESPAAAHPHARCTAWPRRGARSRLSASPRSTANVSSLVDITMSPRGSALAPRAKGARAMDRLKYTPMGYMLRLSLRADRPRARREGDRWGSGSPGAVEARRGESGVRGAPDRAPTPPRGRGGDGERGAPGRASLARPRCAQREGVSTE